MIGVTPPSARVDQAAPGAAVPRNGLLDVGGATLITNMATLGLMDSATHEQVVEAGGKLDYTVRMFPVPGTMPQLPMIMIESTESDPIAAKKTVELVVAQADSALRTLQRQAGVADDQMVRPFVVSAPLVPIPGMPNRTKSTVAVFVAGAGIAILVGTVVDVLLTRWKARRRERRQTGIQAADGPDTADGETNGQTQDTHAAAGEIAVDSR